MSFSSTVKNELCRIEINDNCCLLSELAAVIRIGGTISTGPNGTNIRIVTENAAFARRVFSLIRKLYHVNSEVIIRKSKRLKKHVAYSLVITSDIVSSKMLEELGFHKSNDPEQRSGEYSFNIRKLMRKACCRKAYLRGAFLTGGSVSDPEKTYHLEIANHSRDAALELNRVMGSFNLNAKVIRRKGNFVTYLKEGENIVDFLNAIGAHLALLELENVRILKEMRNNVNRIVNCETANLEKTVNASVRQVENIKYIRDNMGFGKLSESLREIAELRLMYSDASLKELGEMLAPPLGKSGVNHRLRKLDSIAEKERELKGGQ